MAAACALAMSATAAEGARRAPDLSVAKLGLAGAPAPGQAFTATVTLKNAGKARAKASHTATSASAASPAAGTSCAARWSCRTR
jgi:hypothetical protein